MSITKYYPRRIDPHRFARNAFIPESPFIRSVSTDLNHVQAYRRKVFFSRGDLVNVPTGASGTTTLYRFHCHTGYAATSIVFQIGMAYSSGFGIGSATDPRVDCNCTISGGATTTETAHHGLNAGGVITDGPDEIVEKIVKVAVTAATTYEVSVDVIDYARVMWICVYEEAGHEIDTAVNYYVNQNASSVGFPILDSYRNDLLVAASNVWRRNGTHLLTWPGEETSKIPSTNSTTFRNIIDDTTTVNANSFGFYIDNQAGDITQLCRQSDGYTLDVVLAVHCSVTGSATGEVRLETSGGKLCDITAMGTAAAWYTTTTTINTNSIAKVDVQYRTSNGANTITLNAVSCYTYLA